MALLQGDKALLYLPFTSGYLGMYAQPDASWSNDSWYGRLTSAGYIGSGAIASADNNTIKLSRAVSGADPPNSGSRSFTIALWAGGLEINRYFAIGYGLNATRLYHGIKLVGQGAGVSGWHVKYVRNSDIDTGSGGYYRFCDGWHFLVGRVEFDGFNVSGLLSVDGSDWVNCGVVAQSGFCEDSLGYLNVEWRCEAPGGLRRPVDEYTCWRNADRFTIDELENLHNLGYIHERPLDQYTEQIPSKWCPLYVAGPITVSGSLPLTIEGLRPSGFLKPDNVVFYLPFTSGFHDRATGDIEWTVNSYPMRTQSGLLGSGVYGSAGSNGAVYHPAGDPYLPAAGTQSLTAAIWASGNLANAVWRLGYATASASPRNAIQLAITAGSGTQLGHQEQSSTVTVFADTGPSVDGAGWTFLVWRVAWEDIDGDIIASGDLSINGSGWYSFGEQLANALPGGTGNTPEFYWKPSAGSSQVVDEAILWRNADKFATDELANLYALGRTQGRPMDEYVPPTSGGPSPSVASGLLDLVMAGTASPPVASGADFTIESLLRTHDHDPQIIGKLDCLPPASVCIEVWYCGDTQVPVALASSGCYPIGNTGRWGWSTQYLLQPWPTRRPQFYYRMTGPGGKTFEGQFFMNSPHGARRMPRTVSDYTINPLG